MDRQRKKYRQTDGSTDILTDRQGQADGKHLVNICIYVQIDRGSHTNIWTDRQTDRCRQTERQTGGQIYRQKELQEAIY